MPTRNRKISFKDLSIRSKLLIGYLTAFMIFFTASGILFYQTMRKTLEANIESELNNTTKTILNMVKSTANASIRNYLRAVAEKNREIVDSYYHLYEKGAISENAAKAQAAAILLSQKIGTTGYIYCIDSRGVIQVHPVAQLHKRDISSYAFVREQRRRKEGYIEYDWMNPGESDPRPKALYMSYFSEWDWIISVSSYREEFTTLINVDDFKESILSLKFGETGYTYIIDSKGSVIIHPELTGNYLEAEDSSGGKFVRLICEKKNGKLIYSWKNPSDRNYREKFALFNHIPEFDWIVVSTSYVDEFYGPLDNLRGIIAAMIATSTLFLLLLTYVYSSYITKVLRDLALGFQKGIAGDFSARLLRISRDEFGTLGGYFNAFMERLQSYHRSLQEEITERKRSEDALKESEQKIREIIDFLPDATFAINTEGKIILWNRTAEEYTGVSRSDMIGRGNYEYAKPFYGEARPLLVDIALNPDSADKSMYPVLSFRGCSVKGENYTNYAGKGKAYMQGVAAPLYDDQGRIIGAIESIRDITDIKKNEERLTSVLQAATNYSIIGTDESGLIRIFNEGSELMLGYKKEEVIGKNYYTLLHDPDEIAAHAKELQINPGISVFTSQAARGSTETGEWTYIRKDRSRLKVSLTVAPMRNDSGEITGYIGIARDITNEKNMEQQLLQSQKMESIGLLAGGIAHDFNNLLTPILGYTEIMCQETDESDTKSKYLLNILHAATRAKDLTQQLLAFSRKQIIELKIVNLGNILEKMEPMLRRMIRENISLKIHIKPTSPVRADNGQIEQVLLNLAVNAQDAMPDGGTLSFEVDEIDIDKTYYEKKREVKPGNYVMATVSDTGLGMDPHTVEHIFEPFFTTKPAGKGTGLGLSTVYGIIKQHEGAICVYSEPGKGSSFRVFIPRIKDETEPVGLLLAEKVTIARGSETILIAEDNELVLQLTTQMLESLGYRVIHAENLDESIIALSGKGNTIDLLITDVVMPGMNGKDLYAELTKIHPKLKVIFMSGYTSDVIGHHGILDEGVNFISKPFTLQSLSQKVRQVLDQK